MTKPSKKKPQPGGVHGLTIKDCTFTGGVSDRQCDALLALAQAMAEQAKAVQAVAAALKGPNSLLQVGGAA